MSSPKARLRAKKSRRLTIGVYLDEEPADRLDAFSTALDRARRERQPDEVLEAIVKELAKASDDLDEATMWFTFQGIGTTRFEALVAEHPATEVDTGFDYDTTTFPPALMAAACISPAGLEVSDFAEIWASQAWNDEERGQLFGAALGVCTRARALRTRPQS